jgi:hypothetical protein
MTHDERCPECKDTVYKMLQGIYGTAIRNYRLKIWTRPNDYSGKPIYSSLAGIYSALEKHRGYTGFVKADFVDVDFFISNPGFIVEFDESQHFTKPRKISLEQYPESINTGFSKERWIALCNELDKHDRDPPYRDEQRAWYDTLRDFLPEIKGFKPTVRLYSRDREWCKLDPDNPADVRWFLNHIGQQGNEKTKEPPKGFSTDFIATVILGSKVLFPEWGLKQEKDPALNGMRMSEMKQIIAAILNDTDRDGVIVFPAGWFHSGMDPADFLYTWVTDEIKKSLEITTRKIVICLGIDGLFDRPKDDDPFDQDQIALAIDRSGIIALGRKFFCRDDEAPIIHSASGYLDKEQGKDRIFELNGVRFYLFECNDIKAPYSKGANYPNPGIDIGLNLIHRIYEKGTDESGRKRPLTQENNFACIFGSRTSHAWNVPVFLSAIFFRRSIPEDWPTGVFSSRLSYHRVGYREIALKYSVQRKIELDEGYALLSIFQNIGELIERRKHSPVELPDKSPRKNTPPSQNNPDELLLFSMLFNNLKDLFGDSFIEQKTKITFRGRNRIGFPNRQELDMVVLYKPSRNQHSYIKFRLYPYVLAGHCNVPDVIQLDQIIPVTYIEGQERKNPHPAEKFVEGVFSQPGEIKQFCEEIQSLCKGG